MISFCRAADFHVLKSMPEDHSQEMIRAKPRRLLRRDPRYWASGEARGRISPVFAKQPAGLFGGKRTPKRLPAPRLISRQPGLAGDLSNPGKIKT